ncbi:MAG TPA: glycosyltransferase family 39 protein [Steroidobacteraceae bacterium]|nr:glycosyltransferase family 39 protein [Steroidobacteraceae bacterium]
MLGTRAIERAKPATLVRAAGRAPAELWPLILAGTIVLALGIPMLLFPFGPDQGIFAYIAHRILHGGFPYVDAWDQKPPAIYLVYALALNFPGALMRNVRLFDLFMLALTMGALFLLGRHLWDRWSGGLAALLYGAAYTTLYGYWHTAQPDGYVGLPLALALWLYYRFLARPRAWAYLVAGALTGFAFELRFFSAFIGLGLLLIEWDAAGGAIARAWRGAVVRIAWFSTGFALTQAAFVVYLLAGHALGAFLYTEFRFATGYARLGGPYSPNGFRWDLYLDAARGNTLLFLQTHFFITIPAVAAIILGFRRGGDPRIRQMGLFVLVSYLGVLIQAKFFWYHWLAVLPFFALLGGFGLAALLRRVASGRSQFKASLAVSGVLLLLVLVTPALTDNAFAQWQGFVRYFADPGSRHAYNNQFGPYGAGPYSYLADDEVGRYLKQHTRQGDTIYIFGYEALVYLLSGRESASRFFYTFPVISTWSPPAWQTEFLSDLNSKRPRYIVIESDEGAPWITGLHEDTAQYAAAFQPLQQLLAARYSKDRQIEDFTLYRLR